MDNFENDMYDAVRHSLDKYFPFEDNENYTIKLSRAAIEAIMREALKDMYITSMVEEQNRAIMKSIENKEARDET